MSLPPLPIPDNPIVFIVIDPAAGGPQSDYAIVSMIRHRGSVMVSHMQVRNLGNRPCVRTFLYKSDGI